MSSFLYFAYGSNMLSARLRGRCPGASFAGLAQAEGYALSFSKKGRDGSGKATIGRVAGAGARVEGVLYLVPAAERGALDRAEGGYLRDDDFPVTAAGGRMLRVTTYMAPPRSCASGLRPFDWYLALMKAGAVEHGLGPDTVALIGSAPVMADPDEERSRQMFKLALEGQ